MLTTPNIASQLGEHQIKGLHHARPSSKNGAEQAGNKVAQEDSVELSQEGIVRLRRLQTDEIAAQNLMAAGSSYSGYQEAMELLNDLDLG
ncbi:MAG: hypothetical protein QGH40_15125 [bacterium]|jgi:hypothetical protein|nr:hypothetical protein [bacterium]|tara:strand:- start:61 stop:330 length:270 start_codon:yes stop_codon:yes gene_type:complete